MSDMKTELCAKCNNTVLGEFTPSKTREWLTCDSEIDKSIIKNGLK